MTSEKKTKQLIYLYGALDLACFLTGNMGLDEATVFSLPKEGFTEAFQKEFCCRKYPLELTDSALTLKEAFRDFLGDESEDSKISANLAKMTEYSFGKTEKICFDKDHRKLIDTLGGRNGPFWNISDIFFAVMPEEILCFFSGNFE